MSEIRGRLDEVVFHAKSLEGNRLGDSADRREYIYLPPSYDSSPSRRYPVVYFLHGFSLASGVQRATAQALEQAMNRLISRNAIQEMIVVVPDGTNSLGGSFYVNSATTGHYEDYIVKELVPFVDLKYRTIASADSRGIGGHSMGGFGAIRLGFNHTDIFGAVYAMSPCCLEFGADSPIAATAWKEVLAIKTAADANQLRQDNRFFAAVYIAMAAALSPDGARPPLFSSFPFREENGKFLANEPAYGEWKSYSISDQIRAHTRELLRLRGIAMDYGTREDDVYIPLGARALSKDLAELKIPNELEVFDGDHLSEETSRMETKLLPFFSSILEGPPATSITKAP